MSQGREAGTVAPAREPGARLLSWSEVKSLVLDTLSSPHSKRAYSRALEDFARWARAEGLGGDNFSRAVVQRYRSQLEEKGLSPSSINVALAALRKLAAETADHGLLDPAIASAIGRVKGAAQKGRRIGRWLNREEASLLLRDSGEEGLKAKRDRALLCLLLGAGLRREELVSLEIDHIQQREGRWVITDLIGKRKRIRTVRSRRGRRWRSTNGPTARELPGENCFGRWTRPAGSPAIRFPPRPFTSSSPTDQGESG